MFDLGSLPAWAGVSSAHGVPAMTSDRLTADPAFIGHMCLREVVPIGGSPRVAPGGAVSCRAPAGAGIGTSVAVVTRVTTKDGPFDGTLSDVPARMKTTAAR